jgi:hypothetical protein
VGIFLTGHGCSSAPDGQFHVKHLGVHNLIWGHYTLWKGTTMPKVAMLKKIGLVTLFKSGMKKLGDHENKTITGST